MSDRAQSSATGHHPAVTRRLEATMKRHQYAPDALIEVLHQTQVFCYLEEDRRSILLEV